MQYDLLIKNGYVVDYASAREGYFDVAVQNGMIAAVESSIGGSAVRELDASGKLVLPGLVDSHVHASAWLGGSYAHTMLVKAGVTSALDMSGPGTSVLELAREYGTGLNLATIEYVRPGHTVSSDDPSSAELQQLITKVQRQGSLGIKLLGGHYPLTVAATARAIRAAAELGAYTAFHAGTAAHGSNIEGLLEAVELGGLSLQELVAKISYQPARLLGLANKGSLTAGRDADITIVDRLQRSAFATIIGGQVCYMDGKVLGRGGRIITTAAGADYVRSQGLEPLVVDLADSSLLQKAQKR